MAGRYEQWLGVVCSCGEVMRPTGAEKVSSKNIINDRLTKKNLIGYGETRGYFLVFLRFSLVDLV